MMSALCSPAFDVKEGDIVTIVQCRSLARTVLFNVCKAPNNIILGSIARLAIRHLEEKGIITLVGDRSSALIFYTRKINSDE